MKKVVTIALLALAGLLTSQSESNDSVLWPRNVITCDVTINDTGYAACFHATNSLLPQASDRAVTRSSWQNKTMGYVIGILPQT